MPSTQDDILLTLGIDSDNAEKKLEAFDKKTEKKLLSLNKRKKKIYINSREDQRKVLELELKDIEKSMDERLNVLGDNILQSAKKAQKARQAQAQANKIANSAEAKEKEKLAQTIINTEAKKREKIRQLENRLSIETRAIHKKGISDQIKLLKSRTARNKDELNEMLHDTKIIQGKTNEEFRKMSRSWKGVLDSSTGTTFAHKALTTAQYTAAGAGLFAIANAMRSVVAESVKYDDAIYNNMSVLNASRESAEELAIANRELSTSYGGSIEEIDNLSLTLGRAGVNLDNINDATKASVELAKITGDSFGDAAKVMSTFIIAYEDSGTSVEDLSSKLTYMANESKLSVEDLGTLSNYALSTAKSLDLTVDSVGALATTFSNLGLNASTIGTQIRKLDVIFKSSKGNVQDFWRVAGETQDSFRVKVKDNSQGVVDFANLVANMSEDQFIQATRNMEILEKQLVSNMRNGRDLIIEHTAAIEKALSAETQAQIKSLGATTMMERAWNAVQTSANGAITEIVDMAGREEVTELVDSHSKLVNHYKDLKVELAKLTEGTDEYAKKLVEVNEKNERIEIASRNINSKIKSINGAFTDLVNTFTPMVGRLAGAITSVSMVFSNGLIVVENISRRLHQWADMLTTIGMTEAKIKELRNTDNIISENMKQIKSLDDIVDAHTRVYEAIVKGKKDVAKAEEKYSTPEIVYLGDDGKPIKKLTPEEQSKESKDSYSDTYANVKAKARLLELENEILYLQKDGYDVNVKRLSDLSIELQVKKDLLSFLEENKSLSGDIRKENADILTAKRDILKAEKAIESEKIKQAEASEAENRKTERLQIRENERLRKIQDIRQETEAIYALIDRTDSANYSKTDIDLDLIDAERDLILKRIEDRKADLLHAGTMEEKQRIEKELASAELALAKDTRKGQLEWADLQLDLENELLALTMSEADITKKSNEDELYMMERKLELAVDSLEISQENANVILETLEKLHEMSEKVEKIGNPTGSASIGTAHSFLSGKVYEEFQVQAQTSSFFGVQAKKGFHATVAQLQNEHNTEINRIQGEFLLTSNTIKNDLEETLTNNGEEARIEFEKAQDAIIHTAEVMKYEISDAMDLVVEKARIAVQSAQADLEYQVSSSGGDYGLSALESQKINLQNSVNSKVSEYWKEKNYADSLPRGAVWTTDQKLIDERHAYYAAQRVAEYTYNEYVALSNQVAAVTLKITAAQDNIDAENDSLKELADAVQSATQDYTKAIEAQVTQGFVKTTGDFFSGLVSTDDVSDDQIASYFGTSIDDLASVLQKVQNNIVLAYQNRDDVEATQGGMLGSAPEVAGFESEAGLAYQRLTALGYDFSLPEYFNDSVQDTYSEMAEAFNLAKEMQKSITESILGVQDSFISDEDKLESAKTFLESLDSTGIDFTNLELFVDSLGGISNSQIIDMEQLSESINLVIGEFDDLADANQDLIDSLESMSGGFDDMLESLDTAISNLLGNNGDGTDNQVEQFWNNISEIDGLLTTGSEMSSEDYKRLQDLVGTTGTLSSSIQSGYFGDTEGMTANLVSELQRVEGDVANVKEVIDVNILSYSDAFATLYSDLGLDATSVKAMNTLATNLASTDTDIETLTTDLASASFTFDEDSITKLNTIVTSMSSVDVSINSESVLAMISAIEATNFTFSASDVTDISNLIASLKEFDIDINEAGVTSLVSALETTEFVFSTENLSSLASILADNFVTIDEMTILAGILGGSTEDAADFVKDAGIKTDYQGPPPTAGVNTATNIDSGDGGWQMITAMSDTSASKIDADNAGEMEVMWQFGSDGKWKGYSSNAEVSKKMTDNGYDVIDEINAGEGFWTFVNSDTDGSINVEGTSDSFDTAAEIANADAGWSMIGVNKDMSISSLSGIENINLLWAYADGIWKYFTNDSKQNDILDNLGYNQIDELKKGSSVWLNSFDTGTSFVSHDQTANIHKGEIIIDPKSSDILRNYGINVSSENNSKEVISELQNNNNLLRSILSENRSLTKETKRVGRTDGIISLQGARL